MLTIYENRAGTLEPQKGKPRITEAAVWIDLINPTPEEEAKIERALKFDVPTREEQQEIEASSRLYQEDGAYFMTATMLYQPEQGEPRTTPVTFILSGQRLVTVRYAQPRAFAIYVARCNRAETDLKSGAAVLIGLLETIVDRLADFIERIQAEVEGLSHSIFEIRGAAAARQRRFDVMLRAIGREGEITSKARESAHSFGRLLTYLAHAVNERKEVKPLQARVRTAARDVTSLDRPRHLSIGQDHLSARCHARHDQHPAERHHQDLLGRRRRVPAADADRVDLRHELPSHAGARVVVRLSARAPVDGAGGGASLSLLQT